MLCKKYCYIKIILYINNLLYKIILCIKHVMYIIKKIKIKRFNHLNI